MDTIKAVVEQQLHTAVISVTDIGKGATATAFCVETETAHCKLVVKTGKYAELLCREKEMLNFLASKVDYKVPKTYFYVHDGNRAYLGMEYIEGTNGANRKILLLRNKKQLANCIVDGLLDMQSVKNDKFGAFDNAEYDTWQEYYTDFFESIFAFTMKKYKNGEINHVVIDALNEARLHFDAIFQDVSKTACISHGDYWMANMLIDTKNCTVAGVIDPNNVAWVEPEYELFAMTVGHGKILNLYKIYKKRKTVSRYCDLKIELYALVNELDWYKNLGFCPKNYLYYRARRLRKQIKKNKLKETES